MDSMSEVVSVFKLQSCVGAGFDNGGEWSFQFDRYNGIKCFALVSGQCWLRAEGLPQALHLQTGDFFLLPKGVPFVVASDLDVRSIAAELLIATPMTGPTKIWHGGGNGLLQGAHFRFSGSQADSLLKDLPVVLHVHKEAEKTSLQWFIKQIIVELAEQRLGGSIIVQHLVKSLLTQTLRLYLEGHLDHRIGWLRAMEDVQLEMAIAAMHQDPGQPWTLQELAHVSGMSRSSFAHRFKATVGVSAMEYLIRWRVLLAGDRLLTTEETVYQIAFSLGYDSEASFRTAFRKLMARSPKQYRRDQEGVPLLGRCNVGMRFTRE